MATSKSSEDSKNRFWNKFRPAPKPIPRRKRITSDSGVPTLPHPQPHRTPLTPPSISTRRELTLPRIAATATEQDPEPKIKYLTKEMTLSDFACKYQNSLPQQVMVTYGVYWRENEEINISSSERLNIHFIRHRESVKIREQGSDVEYSLPMTSTLEFGPVYNPNKGNLKDALRGFIYPAVSDLLKVTENAPLPKFVTATTSSSRTTPGDRVTKGELLLIKEVRSSAKFGYRQLRVFSVTTKTDKFLHEDCAGNFTTKSEANKLSIFSIIKYVPNVLPLSVKIFPGPNLDLGDQHYPTHLFHKVIQLCRTFTDVLLVASSVPEDSVCDGREPFEIPQEVELELKVIELRDSDYEQLREKSQQIMRQIQGDYLKQYRNTHQEQANYVVQEMFLRAVGTVEEDNTAVAEIQEDTSANGHDRNYPNVKPLQEGLMSRLSQLEEIVWRMRRARATPSASVSNSTGEVTVGEGDEVGVGGETEVQKLRDQVERLTATTETISTHVTELKLLVDVEEKRVQDSVGQLQTEVASLRVEVEEERKLLMELRETPLHPRQVTSLYVQELLASPETAKRNRDLVTTLTVDQVLQLVTEVGVEDVQKITQEKVTGDILVELNEDELESELGITKRIHRLKLMKVINGSKPVTEYLKEHEFKSMDIVC